MNAMQNSIKATLGALLLAGLTGAPCTTRAYAAASPQNSNAPAPQTPLTLHTPTTPTLGAGAYKHHRKHHSRRRRHAAEQASQGLTLAVGTGQLIRLEQAAATVFVADPTVADVQVPTSNDVFVLGKKPGSTTVFALDSQGTPLLQRTITVVHNLAELQSVLVQRFPNLQLTLKSAPGSLMVSGAVSNAQEINAVSQTLQPYLSEKESLINQMTLTTPTQVNLHVRVAEVERTTLEQIGVNWSALGQNGGIFSGRTAFTVSDSFPPVTYNLPTNSGFMAVLGNAAGGHGGSVDMLDQENLLTTLAEPNLTAISGETASFLAGGEYPIPTVQSGTTSSISVTYKDFGVGLEFTPTVLANNRINLKVRPEVSQLDTANSVTSGGVTVPGLDVRRVETTVELGSGESFVIGGLLEDNIRDQISKFPGLASLPILGRLFSSTDYQDDKSELVIIVTPYLVHPVGPGQLQTPVDTTLNPSAVETLLQKQARLDPYDSATPRLSGNAGFVY
jgi:pilus assembly protein CpaC